MELSWPIRLRIAASAAVGIVLIAILGWPLAAPPEPFGAVLAGNISFGGKIILAVLAFLAGFTAYFLSWPYGREIGILAVPSGLTIWAVRSGSMAALCQQNPTAALRGAIFATLKWEPIFWLAIVAAGFGGVLLAHAIATLRSSESTSLRSTRWRPKHSPNKNHQKANSGVSRYLNAAIALVGSALIAQFLIAILAQDVRIFDNRLGSVVSQPATGQIVFAVSVSFGLVAFVFKKFFDVSYIWPIIGSALVTGFAIGTYIGQDTLQYFVVRHPAVFFASAVISILPVQMVAFGTLGAIAGYWLAVRYDYWLKHESK